MAGLEPSGPNAEQIKYWNEVSGPKWVALNQFVDAQLSLLGLQAMDRAGVRVGERVLDIGCGCGDTTLELARRVGPAGAVLGIDISTLMLERARARAEGFRHVHFENADAQTFQFPPQSFDLVFSRFGVMFFAHPEEAFANLRAALRHGGRLTFICWRAIQQNPWMLVPLMAAAEHITLPAPPAPDAPGPFSLADDNRVRRILSGAGFADVAIEELNDTLAVGGGMELDQTVDLLLQIGPLGAALREAGAAKRSLVALAVREAVAPFATPAGIRMPAAAWIVTGRNP
jgi:SAM-dependent methyltransferase